MKWILLLGTIIVVYLSLANVKGVTGATGPGHDRVIVCYVATWAVYRPARGSFALDDLDPSLCTHLVYSFAGLDTAESGIKSLDPWQDLKDNYGKGGYEKLTGLKTKYPHLKVTLAIGGWNEGSINYSKLAENPQMRQKFITSAVIFLKKYNFDGLDLDWEYPAKRGGSADDKQNYVLLVKELKAEFNKHNLILTAALGASKETIDVSYDVAQLSQYLDLIHMMCYDYHGSWDGKVGPNSPLHGESEFDALSVEYTVNYMLNMGAPPEKLVLGLPLYGRTFIRESQMQLGVGPTPTSHSPPQMGETKTQPAGFPGPYTREAGFMGYNEICTELANVSSGWSEMWDSKSKTPYAYNGDKFITFDNQRSLVEKVRYAMSKKLRGLMVWSIDTDDFKGDCPPEKDIFSEFYNSLNTLEKSPYFSDVLPELGLPNGSEDDSARINDFSGYVLQNGEVSLVVPLRSSTNFPLMRTLEQAVILSKQEQRFVDKIERKIKEKERENEIGHEEHHHASSGQRLIVNGSLVIALFVVLYSNL